MAFNGLWIQILHIVRATAISWSYFQSNTVEIILIATNAT